MRACRSALCEHLLPHPHPKQHPLVSIPQSCVSSDFICYIGPSSFAGLYVQEMADASMAKLYSGLLGVGDEILEVNGAKVAGLSVAHIKELLAREDSLSVRVLRQRPVPR